MDRRDIVVVGGSAGSSLPFVQLVAGLPEDFPATVFLAMHARGRVALLPRLSRAASPSSLMRMLKLWHGRRAHAGDEEPGRPGLARCGQWHHQRGLDRLWPRTGAKDSDRTW
jgi:hypothetical protein